MFEATRDKATEDIMGAPIQSEEKPLTKIGARDIRTPFVPLVMLSLALLLWSGFQTVQLFSERGNLYTIRANQETPEQNSRKLRAALDTLAAGTVKLAEQGNTNAQIIVVELQKRGITINPNSQPAK